MEDISRPVKLAFEDIEYTHILTVLSNLMSDFRYESLTYSELEYVHDALTNAHMNYIKFYGKGENDL